MRMFGLTQATLPEDMEEDTLDSMLTGESAYTTPWGMWVDAERQCWLHPAYPAHKRPGGTVEMRVERRQDGYHVWPPRGYKYKPSSEPGFVSPRDTQYIPVVRLHR